MSTPPGKSSLLCHSHGEGVAWILIPHPLYLTSETDYVPMSSLCTSRWQPFSRPQHTENVGYDSGFIERPFPAHHIAKQAQESDLPRVHSRTSIESLFSYGTPFGQQSNWVILDRGVGDQRSLLCPFDIQSRSLCIWASCVCPQDTLPSPFPWEGCLLNLLWL